MSGLHQSGTVTGGGSPGTDVPRDARRARVALRVLAVFFLVPLVVFSNPTHAAAAAATKVTFVLSRVQWDITCETNVTGEGAWSAGYCAGGVDTTPGYGGIPEAGATFGLVWKGVDGSGSTFAATGGGQLGPHPADSMWEMVASLPAGTVDLPAGATVTEICLSLFEDTAGFGTDSASTCVQVTLETPSAETCPYAVFGKPELQQAWNSAGRTYRTAKTVFTSWQNGLTTAQRDWRFYAVQKPPSPFQTTDATQANTVQGLVGLNGDSHPLPSTWDGVSISVNNHNVELGPTYPTEDWPVIGYGVYLVAPGQITDDTPQETAGGIIGVNDPGNCLFYWGEKIADQPNADTDEPAGPLVGDPEPATPDPVEPPGADETDAPADEPSFWETLVRLVQRLVAAVGRIASAILDGLGSVFIPDEGIQPRVERVQGAYADRAPFVFADLGSLSDAVGSGCPDWRVKVPGPSGTIAVDSNVVCESSFTAAIRDARPFLAAGVIAAAFFPFLRSVLYSAMPVLKPHPTSSGDGRG